MNFRKKFNILSMLASLNNELKKIKASSINKYFLFSLFVYFMIILQQKMCIECSGSEYK